MSRERRQQGWLCFITAVCAAPVVSPPPSLMLRSFVAAALPLGACLFHPPFWSHVLPDLLLLHAALHSIGFLLTCHEMCTYLYISLKHCQARYSVLGQVFLALARPFLTALTWHKEPRALLQTICMVRFRVPLATLPHPGIPSSEVPFLCNSQRPLLLLILGPM